MYNVVEFEFGVVDVGDKVEDIGRKDIYYISYKYWGWCSFYGVFGYFELRDFFLGILKLWIWILI